MQIQSHRAVSSNRVDSVDMAVGGQRVAYKSRHVIVARMGVSQVPC
jgi:hypothetical protein